MSDGGGLYLRINPDGGKFWRWQYRFQGKPQLLSIGRYPSMSLTEARTEHQRLQDVLRGGVNPGATKKTTKMAGAALAKLNREHSALVKFNQSTAKLNHERPVLAESAEKIVAWPAGSFGAVQKEWFKKWSDGKSPRYRDQMESRLKADILPKLGHRHITDIEAPDIAEMAKLIDSRGAGELARRALFTTGQIFRFAIAHGYARRNPVSDLKPGDVLKSKTVIHCA